MQNVSNLLHEIQQGLFERAFQLRKNNTVRIDDLDEFRSYFTPQRDEQPEIHGGFALCHCAEDRAVNEILKQLKVTIRCVALNNEEEPGNCVFTGKPTRNRLVFAKAY